MQTQAEWESAFLEALAARVRAERQERGLSQEQLAQSSRLHVNTVRLLEYGKRMPSVLVLAQIAAGLGLSASGLLERVEAEVGPMRWLTEGGLSESQ